MDNPQELIPFVHKLASDIRLKPNHISLCFALYHAWVGSSFQNIFQVSRSKLMGTSRIRSRATYHKTMKDLQAFGYLKYTPSYHPVNGSSVALVIGDFEWNQGVSKVSDDVAQGQAHF
ncbi:hypothetical protein [Chryseolinea sp. H1M3-3]|uniref:hypothetical protein n=1 Tax=Chryseolinea sp. H1M3-3 TaxID=3034144 RepID=UPI0023ECDCF2|nr:hypothetical protein [Chryseolinea sp. H1M3-3]